MLKRIKEAYTRAHGKELRAYFEKAMKSKNYEYALFLAEVNSKKFDLSTRDTDRLRAGFNEYQERLKNLEGLLNDR